MSLAIGRSNTRSLQKLKVQVDQDHSYYRVPDLAEAQQLLAKSHWKYKTHNPLLLQRDQTIIAAFLNPMALRIGEVAKMKKNMYDPRQRILIYPGDPPLHKKHRDNGPQEDCRVCKDWQENRERNPIRREKHSHTAIFWIPRKGDYYQSGQLLTSWIQDVVPDADDYLFPPFPYGVPNWSKHISTGRIRQIIDASSEGAAFPHLLKGVVISDLVDRPSIGTPKRAEAITGTHWQTIDRSYYLAKADREVIET